MKINPILSASAMLTVVSLITSAPAQDRNHADIVFLKATQLAGGCHVERLHPADFDIESAWLTYGEISGMQTGVHINSALRYLAHLLSKPYRDSIPPFSRLYFEPMSFKKYMAALERRDSLISTLETFLSQWDAWLCPVTACAAFEHLDPDYYISPLPYYYTPIYIDEQPVDYYIANVSFTTVFNLTGSPVVVIPIGTTDKGLPIGIQVVGRRWQDMRLLAVAESLAEVAGPLQHPPGF